MKALVFPGQGSQKIGMALNLVKTFPWAAKIARNAEGILGREITKIMFEGPESELKQTVNTQPALFLTEALLTDAVREMGIPFSAVAGHSLGEYSALYAAKAASFEDLLRLVDIRAKAMSTAVPSGIGAMAAVFNLDSEILSEICAEVSAENVCVMANLNCPGQIVISGTAEGVKRVSEMAKAKGAKRIFPLEVSGPFHSPLMEPAREKLAEAIASIKFCDSTIDVYQNVDAQPSRKADTFKDKLLAQLTGSVKWEPLIRNMYAGGHRTFIELGPGKILSGLIKKIVPDSQLLQAEDPETLSMLSQSKTESVAQ
ncbi:MAG: ACP S-malonyltransferase [Candidatus Riflebacteria bacterium]|nr:ACP S-malonyltransferase [Candidatus Riflebacteria bacterium]